MGPVWTWDAIGGHVLLDWSVSSPQVGPDHFGKKRKLHIHVYCLSWRLTSLVWFPSKFTSTSLADCFFHFPNILLKPQEKENMVSCQRSSFVEAHLAFKGSRIPGLHGEMHWSGELLSWMIQAEKTYRGTLGVGTGLSITRQEGHGEGREGERGWNQDRFQLPLCFPWWWRFREAGPLLTAPDTGPTDARQRVFLLLGAWPPQGPSLDLTLKNLPFTAQDLCGEGGSSPRAHTHAPRLGGIPSPVLCSPRDLPQFTGLPSVTPSFRGSRAPPNGALGVFWTPLVSTASFSLSGCPHYPPRPAVPSAFIRHRPRVNSVTPPPVWP